MKKIWLIAALLLIASLFFFLFLQKFKLASNETLKPKPAPDPSAVIPAPPPTVTVQKQLYPVYPNPNLTPARREKLYLNVTEAEVCTPGYSKKVRKVSEKVRREVFKKYGIPYPPPKDAYELDHFCPLELGCSNDIENLWPEPAGPDKGFRIKDKVENYLHRKVCDKKTSPSKRMKLDEARELIITDWYKVYTDMYLPERQKKLEKAP